MEVVRWKVMQSCGHIWGVPKGAPNVARIAARNGARIGARNIFVKNTRICKHVLETSKVDRIFG